MNQRAYIHLEITKSDTSGQDRVYTLSLPFGSSYQECYDVAMEMANNIIEISKTADEAAKKAQAEKDAVAQPESAPQGD